MGVVTVLPDKNLNDYFLKKNNSLHSIYGINLLNEEIYAKKPFIEISLLDYFKSEQKDWIFSFSIGDENYQSKIKFIDNLKYENLLNKMESCFMTMKKELFFEKLEISTSKMTWAEFREKRNKK